MADKYLYNNSGAITEREGITSSAGAGDTGKIPALDGSGKLDSSFLPVGVGADTLSIVCSENLAAGDFVSLWDDSGTGKVRKADASNGRVAHGFVLSAYTSGGTALVYFEGTNTGVTGLTIGSKQYLSGATAGLSTSTAPTTSGYLIQELGYARSATQLPFEPQMTITLA